MLITTHLKTKGEIKSDLQKVEDKIDTKIKALE